MGCVREQHLADARRLGGGLGDAFAAGAGNENMHVPADGLRGAERVVGRGLQVGVVVLGDDQDRHQITFASFLSFSTSAFASGTLTPPLRLAGSSTFSVASRGATSTPSASGFSVSSGFFFAFMMFGSVT